MVDVYVHNVIPCVTKVLETRLSWQFNIVFDAFIIYIVAVFFLIVESHSLERFPF